MKNKNLNILLFGVSWALYHLIQNTRKIETKKILENILEQELLALLDIFPKEKSTCHLLGLLYCYKTLPKYHESERYLKQALKLSRQNKDHARMLNCLGNLYYEMKNYNKGQIFYQQASDKTKYKGLPFLNLALTYEKLGDKKQALIAAKKAEKYLKQEKSLRHSPTTNEELGRLIRRCSR